MCRRCAFQILNLSGVISLFQCYLSIKNKKERVELKRLKYSHFSMGFMIKHIRIYYVILLLFLLLDISHVPFSENISVINILDVSQPGLPQPFKFSFQFFNLLILLLFHWWLSGQRVCIEMTIKQVKVKISFSRSENTYTYKHYVMFHNCQNVTKCEKTCLQSQ